jgi:hypothetical protein
MSRWKFIPAGFGDIGRWSYGTVETRADLYAPRIFGATSNLRCECGKLVGESSVGQRCLECHVTVESDYRSAQATRLGAMKMMSPRCHNPLATRTVFLVLPVLPIAYRLSSDGKPTIIGQKYEKVADLNFRVVVPAGSRVSIEHHPEIQEAINDLFGREHAQIKNAQFGTNSIVELLVQSIINVQDDVDVIARAAGLALELSTMVI